MIATIAERFLSAIAAIVAIIWKPAFTKLVGLYKGGLKARNSRECLQSGFMLPGGSWLHKNSR